MKKSLRLLAALLALCMTAAAGPPAGLAADADGPRASAIDLEQLVQEAAPGSTITLTGNARIEPSVSPWIISKDITIDGGGHTVSVYGTGILLGGNVTFSNMALGLHSADGRNAIIANGHALTLDNVTADELAVNLFCGTLIPAEYEKDKFTVPQPGGAGSITILGKTNLQGPNTASLGTANIFAGSLAMGSFTAGVGTEGDGPANEFAGDAAIRVEDSAGSGALGTIYAGGAQQRMPIGQQSGKVTSPNPRAYTVSGTVSISGAAIPDVDGAGSGATHVAYQGGAYEATRNFEHISSLSVESGRLVLDSWSTFREDGALFLSGGAKLDLKKFDGTDIPVQTFTGQGGTLLLKETQTWTVKGRAEGAAKVAVGDTNFDGSQSTTVPTEGHTYIRTPSGSAAAFQLLPHSRYPDMKLVQDAGGSWKASNSSPGGGVNRVTSFRIVEDTAAATVGEETCIAMEAEFESTDLPTLDFIPLSILVDGRTLNPAPDAENDGYYTYTTMLGELFMTVIGDELCVTPNGADSAGEYKIQVSIPTKYNGSGGTLTDSVTLTVTDGGTTPPSPVVVQVPAAKTGLRYTGLEQAGVEEGAGYTLTGHKGINVGSYTATAALEPGYQWADQTTEEKRIEWSIGKALTAAPAGLSAAAPTSAGGSDGKIIGTTAAMEYASSQDFAGAADCGEGETAGLAEGAYFVRYKETATHEAGAAASITVPAFGAPTVESISVNSSGHKTEYTVGDQLDVSKLTIEAVYSDQSRQTVPVTENMVSGFDPGTAGRQTLTIFYEGAQTTYTVEVSAAQPGHSHQWSGEWTSDAGHHWHECGGEGCPVMEDSGKDGYADHTPGAWITDQAATASKAGSRHKECTVCGYVTARETIPATGGGSSGGGSSSGGGGWYPGNSGNVTSSTQRNPDGSTTTVSTNHSTGAVTTTVNRPDGSQSVVEKAKDGTTTSTEKAKDGSTTVTVRKPDGSSSTTLNRADQVTAQTTVDRYGRAQAQVKLPAQVTQAAQGSGGTIALPIPPLPVTYGGAAALTIQTGRIQPVKVEIPLDRATPGTVAVLTRPDGSQEVVKASVPTEDGLLLEVSNGAVLTVKDNSKSFSDTGGHWAQDAIEFVSARELFHGDPASAFDPNGTMTRAMLMTVLARLDGAATEKNGSWYAGSMDWAVARGVSDGSNPMGLITREQLAVMLYRYAGSPAAANKELRFTDAQAVSGYAQAAMRWAVEKGILNGYGDGALRPGGSATRAETAAVLQRYITVLSK